MTVNTAAENREGRRAAADIPGYPITRVIYDEIPEQTRNPRRIQRRRIKGWRLPPNTRCVDRTTRYGNPWRLVPYGGRYRTIDNHVAYNMTTGWYVALPGGGVVSDNDEPTVYRSKQAAAAAAVALYAEAIETGDPRVPSKAQIRSDLAGLDLACWCPERDPCHGDPLLRIANEDTP